MVLTRYSVVHAHRPRPITVDATHLAVTAMLIAVGSALTVFTWLAKTRPDQSVGLAPASSLVAAAAPPLSRVLPATESSAPIAVQPRVESTEINELAATRTRRSSALTFSEFNLARSRRFQKLGQFSVKLLHTDPRHGTFDLALVVRTQTINQRHVKLNQPIWIAEDNAAPSEIVVSKVSSGRISGTLGSPTPSGEQRPRAVNPELVASAAPE